MTPAQKELARHALMEERYARRVQEVRELKTTIERLTAERDRLERLDAEYGRVEAAIIMADPEFDGDSDHASCGDRLVASVKRIASERDRLRETLTAPTPVRPSLSEFSDAEIEAEHHNRMLRKLGDPRVGVYLSARPTKDT